MTDIPTYDIMDAHRIKQNRNWYNRKWSNFSYEYKKKNIHCVECLKKGILEDSAITDHIIPLKYWMEDPKHTVFDLENIQALCRKCHDYKTRRDGSWIPRLKRNNG